jgi:hypothetical protein
MKDYPPYEFLLRCFENCPIAILNYLTLWQKRRSNLVDLSKLVEECDDTSELDNLFQDIFSLQQCNLLEIVESDAEIYIKLELDQGNDAMIVCDLQ